MNEKNNEVPRKFHIGYLTTVVEGSLCIHSKCGCSHPLEGGYDILDYMTGESLMTHALPRAGESCKPVLLSAYPWLADIEFPGIPDVVRERGDVVEFAAIIDQWLDGLARKYGEYHDVWPLHSDDYEAMHPLEEPILDKFKPEQIITVDLTEPEPPSPTGDIDWNLN